MCNIEDILSLAVINQARLVSRLLITGVTESLDTNCPAAQKCLPQPS